MDHSIDLETVSRLAEDIAVETRGLTVDDHPKRKALVRKAYSLLLSLELPMDTLKRRWVLEGVPTFDCAFYTSPARLVFDVVLVFDV